MGRKAPKRAVGRHTRRRDRVLHTKLTLETHAEAPGCAASSRRQSAGLEVDMRAVGCAGAGLATYEVEIHQNGEQERVLHPMFELTWPPVE